ncbi:hypothetical protein QJS83_03085 [Bdellovibrio sp. 22V]|uniref:hypothetical protein n=1 Tax=Bdellovibrio TaxID=958 RepID=UPI0025438E51|nr:hypothetical protein [Bdellovibrio sp. 22V]WII72853.1 hypothetical protein QJS83_03085 [Bdellovibrio sp. 22V]
MNTWIFVGIAVVSIASILVYLFLMFFFPEWVGITGSVAKKAIESHETGTNATPDDKFLQ